MSFVEYLLSGKYTIVDHCDADQAMEQLIKQGWFFNDA